MTGETKVDPALAESPGALLRLGAALMGSGRGEQAVAIARKLLAARPGDPETLSGVRAMLSHQVPSWHGPMLADEVRNHAFRRAIEAAVAPGATVLDIGTGSGLLAMVAARAGAGRVIACEAHPALAETAREIVEANGLGGVVRVIGRASTELDRDSDLGGGADLIVAEVFSDDLLNEGALATLGHARSALGARTARIIPRAAAVRVALCHRPSEPPRLGDVAGFDLSLFERHLPPQRKLPVGDAKLRLRSAPADLFAFDFEKGTAPRGQRTRLTLACEGGPANGLVQWIRLDLDGRESYENLPEPGGRSHWAASFHPLPGGEAEEGECVAVNAAHDGERLQIWF